MSFGGGGKTWVDWSDGGALLAHPPPPEARLAYSGKAQDCRPQARSNHWGASSMSLQVNDSTTTARMHNLGTTSEWNPSRNPTTDYMEQNRYTARCTAPPLLTSKPTHNQRVPTSLPKQSRNNNLQPQQSCFISSFHMGAYKHCLLVSMYTPHYITQCSPPFTHTYNSLIQSPSQYEITPYHNTTSKLSLSHALPIYKAAPFDYKLLYHIH